MRALFLILFILTSFLTYSQVIEYENIDEEGEAQEALTSSQDPACNDACAEGCVEVSCSEGGIILSGLLIIHHIDIIEMQDDVPIARCVELMPHFAYGPNNNSFSMMPRIIGTWGVLASDLKMNYFNEFNSFSADNTITFHWQPLVIRMMIERQFNIKMSTGFLYDKYDGSLYNEHYMGFDLYMNDYEIKVGLDGRYCFSYSNAEHVYSELNFRIGYNILSSSNSFGYLSVGALYQRIYRNEFGSLQLGLTFNIH